MTETPFDTKCLILSQLNLFAVDTEKYGAFVKRNDLDLYAAMLYHYDYVFLKQPAIDDINRTFQDLMTLVGIEDTGFADVWDIDQDITHEIGGEYDANDI